MCSLTIEALRVFQDGCDLRGIWTRECFIFFWVFHFFFTRVRVKVLRVFQDGCDLRGIWTREGSAGRELRPDIYWWPFSFFLFFFALEESYDPTYTGVLFFFFFLLRWKRATIRHILVAFFFFQINNKLIEMIILTLTWTSTLTFTSLHLTIFFFRLIISS